MKRNVSTFLIIVSFLLSIICLYSFTRTVKAENENLFDIQSKSAYVIDYDTKTLIYSKNSQEKLPIASMCKIMTLNLIFDELENNKLKLDDYIYVSETASGMGGSQIFLDGNTKYQASALIKGIVVASANDACVAFAEHICGSEQAFVEKMNQKAKELEMNNTCFTNCTGLPKIGQYSTAEDVSKMFCELLTHKDYYDYSNIWMDEIRHKNDRITDISNTNKLIRFYEGCDSGKTGYTSEAGHCLACSAKKNNMRVVSVIIKSPDSKTRFRETTSIFNYVFSNYENKKIIDNEINIDKALEINKGKKDLCELKPEKSFYHFSKKGEKSAFEIDLKFYEKLLAPIEQGDVVGEIEIYKNGIKIENIKIIANENIEKNTFRDYVNTIGKKWLINR